VLVGAVILLGAACSDSAPAAEPVTNPNVPVASPSVSPSPSAEPVLLTDVVGEPLSKARTELSRAGFRLQVGTRSATMSQPPGYITSQKPLGYEYYAPGTTVRVNLALAANQWGFNFGCCKAISTPPTGFCTVFRCVRKFGATSGSLMECTDGAYTRATKTAGACSGHDGWWRWLLAPPS
jgi:hypothetical protein